MAPNHKAAPAVDSVDYLSAPTLTYNGKRPELGAIETSPDKPGVKWSEIRETKETDEL